MMKHLIDAAVELEQARRKSCSQVVRITAALAHLEKLYDAIKGPNDRPDFGMAVDEAVAFAEAPTIPEEIPKNELDDGHPPGCRHGKPSEQ